MSQCWAKGFLSFVLFFLFTLSAPWIEAKKLNIDFGHTPMGATQVLKRKICLFKPGSVWNEKTLSYGGPFRVEFLSTEVDDQGCLPARLEFEPGDHTVDQIHYYSIVISRIGLVFSGFGISPDLWQRLYPPSSSSYLYHTSLHVVESGLQDIGFDGFNNLFITLSDRHRARRPTFRFNYSSQGYWVKESEAFRKKGSTSAMVFDPYQNWLVVTDPIKHGFEVYDPFQDQPEEAVSTKFKAPGLFRLNNVAFSPDRQTLFTLGNGDQSGASILTYLSAWRFAPDTGVVGGKLAYQQVGTSTNPDYQSINHGLAVNREGHVFANHLHTSSPYAARFYFNKQKNSFHKINEFKGSKDNLSVGNLDAYIGGRFYAYSLDYGSSVVLDECFSKSCFPLQTFTKSDSGWSNLKVSDLHFGYMKPRLAMVSRRSAGLILLEPAGTSQPWQTTQTIGIEAGIFELPQKVTFSPNDEYLAVMDSGQVHVFERMRAQKIRRRFSWAQVPEWWQHYLQQLSQ